MGWLIGETMTAEQVLSALNMALQLRRSDAVIHHSNHGGQHTSIGFGERWKKWAYVRRLAAWSMPATTQWQAPPYLCHRDAGCYVALRFSADTVAEPGKEPRVAAVTGVEIVGNGNAILVALLTLPFSSADQPRSCTTKPKFKIPSKTREAMRSVPKPATPAAMPSSTPSASDAALSWACDRCRRELQRALIEAAGEDDERSIPFAEVFLPRAIASEPGFLLKFLIDLLTGTTGTTRTPTPVTRCLVTICLSTLDPEGRRAFFGPAETRKSTHPARVAFRAACRNGKMGQAFLDILQIFLSHGLEGELLSNFVESRYEDIAVACRQQNHEFCNVLSSQMTTLPQATLRKVLDGQRNGAIVDFLIKEWSVTADALDKACPTLKPVIFDGRTRRSRNPPKH